MMRRNVTFAIAGLSLLVWLAIGGAAVAEDAVIELHYIAATDVVTMFTPQQVTLRGGGTAAAEERTAVNFAVEAMGRAAGLAPLFSGHAPFVPSGARPAPGTGPVPAIQGVAEAVVREPYGEQPPRAKADAAGAETAGSILPDGLVHQFAVVPGRNAIAVRGTPKAIDEFREIVGLLDTPVKRVNLSVSLVEVAAEGPDEGSLGRTLAEVEFTIANGLCATVSLGEIIPRSSLTISYDANGNREAEFDVEALLAGTCMRIQVQANPDDSVGLWVNSLHIACEGSANVITPMDIRVTHSWEVMIRKQPGDSLMISGPGVVDRWNQMCDERQTPESRIEEDIHTVIVITPTVISPDEGAVE
jgi:hypothetical protein